jgi:hypothetical protein
MQYSLMSLELWHDSPVPSGFSVNTRLSITYILPGLSICNKKSGQLYLSALSFLIVPLIRNSQLRQFPQG